MNESAATPVAPPVASRSAMFIVFFVVFIDLLGFGIVIPMLPLLGKEYVARLPGLGEGTANGVVVGLLMSSFSLMQFLFAPMWGRLSDRLGRRPILLVGLAGSVLFYGLFGFAASLNRESMIPLAVALFFVSRIGAGIAGATIASAQAVIADSTPPEKRKHGMALIGAAFGIGFTFGPLIGYFALGAFKDHPEAIGYTASAISALALVLGVALLPETRRFSEAPPAPRRLINIDGWRHVFRSSTLAPIVLVFFLATFGFAGFEVTLALLLKKLLRVEDYALFPYFAYVGIVLMFTQGFLYRRMAKRVSESAFMTLGILFMGGGVAALAALTYFANPPANAVASIPAMGAGLTSLLYGGLTVAVMGYAFLTPSAQALISRRTDAERQGEILGVNQSAASLARILGPLTFVP